jgi:hypothetical protein
LQTTKTGKTFRHGLIYNVLKQFPKYELDLANIDSQVLKAFSMCDNDAEALGQKKPAASMNIGNKGVDEDLSDRLFITPMPIVGRKKAKLALLAKSQSITTNSSISSSTAQALLTSSFPMNIIILSTVLQPLQRPRMQS